MALLIVGVKGWFISIFFHEVMLLPSVYFLDCSIILDIFDRSAWKFLHKVLNAVLNGMALSDVLFTLFIS